MSNSTEKVKVTITPLMIKKILKALPKNHIHTKMAALAETMQELAVINTEDNDIDESRRICHVYIDAVFDQEESDCGF